MYTNNLSLSLIYTGRANVGYYDFGALELLGFRVCGFEGIRVCGLNCLRDWVLWNKTWNIGVAPTSPLMHSLIYKYIHFTLEVSTYNQSQSHYHTWHLRHWLHSRLLRAIVRSLFFFEIFLNSRKDGGPLFRRRRQFLLLLEIPQGTFYE